MCERQELFKYLHQRKGVLRCDIEITMITNINVVLRFLS